MVRLILGLVAAFIVIMLVLAVVHVIVYYAFFIALLAAVARAGPGRPGARPRRRCHPADIMGNSAVLVASALARISLRRTNVINVMTIITATICPTDDWTGAGQVSP